MGPIIEHTLPRAEELGPQAGIIAVSIGKDGTLMLDGKALADDTELVEVAKRRSGQDPDVRAVIAADAGTLYQRVVTVMDLLRQGGVTRYAFAVTR